MRERLAAFTVLVVLAYAPVTQAQTYRWVDADGNVHYSQDPGSAPAGTLPLDAPVAVPEAAQAVPPPRETQGDSGQDQDADTHIYYEWIDDAGVLHSTDDPSRIPDELRDRVRERRVVQRRVPVNDGTPPWRTEPQQGEAEASIAARRAAAQAQQRQWVETYLELYERFNAQANSLPVARASGKPPQVIRNILGDLGQLQERLRELAAQLKALPQQLETEGGDARWVKDWQELGLPEPPNLDL